MIGLISQCRRMREKRFVRQEGRFSSPTLRIPSNGTPALPARERKPAGHQLHQHK
ncbi:MAG: hypothetical protein MHM6MM_006250 [Cercozoa sp. M6MM]